MNRREALVGVAGAVAFTVLGGCAGSHDAPLRVSITGKGESDYRLLFKAAGIEPDFPLAFSEFQSGHLVIEALNSGSLDFGGASEIPPVFALASTIQSFLQVGVYHGDVNNQVVLVPRGSQIRDLAGLKGKRIGYVRATTSQYFLIRMLESVGLKWSDIDPVALTVTDGAAAFSQGSLDAWAIYGFPIQRAIATEGARILKTALGFLSGNYLALAHRDALADATKSRHIAAYLKLLQKGFAWSSANQGVWAKIVAEEIGVPVSYVQDQFRRKSASYELRQVTPEAIRSQQTVADVFTGAALIPRRVDVRTLWDPRFNSELTKGT